jgi:subtilisin family serine protease
VSNEIDPRFMNTIVLPIIIIALFATRLSPTLIAQPNIPNDPKFSSQWNLRKISAPAAWNRTTGSSNVVVAIIDGGVDYTHPDLAPNMWRNPGETGFDSSGRDKATNGVDDDENGYIDDVHGINAVMGTGDPMDLAPHYGWFAHGTACAGIIAAAGDNSEGGVGVNWNVSLMALSFYWTEDFPTVGGYAALHSGIVRSLEYIVAMKRRGVNIVAISMSIADPHRNEAWREALRIAASEGIIGVYAAGNSPVSNDGITHYPSGYNLPNTLLVASTDANDLLAEDSTFGPGSVHLAAPGVDVFSTINNAGYTTWSGTSAACPHVAGAIALLASAYPGSSADQRVAALLSSGDHLSSLRGKIITGARLNVARALEQMTNTAAPPIILSATPQNARARTNDSVRLRFSRAMDRASVEAGLTITPAVRGEFVWSEDDHTTTFTPSEPLVPAKYSGLLSGSARDLAGRSLDGNYNGISELSPADDFRFTFNFPVSNDDFEDAQGISGRNGSVAGNVRTASPEFTEPDHAGDYRSNTSLWYEWTTLEEGWMTFEIVNSSDDTLLAAYTGTNLVALTSVASSDNYGTRQTSRFSFPAVPVVPYKIAVSGKSETRGKISYDSGLLGPFTMRWYPTPAPGFTGSQFSPSTAAPGAKITLTGTNFTGATAVLFNGVSATFTNAPTNNLDLRITAIVPPDATSGPITILTPHGDVTSTARFEVLRPTLTLTQNPNQQLNLSWSGTAFALESSIDLRLWKQIALGGITNYIITPDDQRAFFRLHQQ